PTTGGGGVAGGELPVGHPRVDPMGSADSEMAAPEPPPAAQTPLQWQMPARWQIVPNATRFRLATYRVPHAAGDAEDAELSVTRAGGSVDANAERWIGQFDASAQKTAKRVLRVVGGLQVTIVDVHGNYTAGMGNDASRSGWALVGAIVSTPGLPHFFKLTGPAKTVLAARGEFNAMIATLVQR
ncbi:MAG: hypothetical protein M3O46_01340, partial [Myxococcota bacterium]|nr:hypothetical protein [Myxococcota bacterium]